MKQYIDIVQNLDGTAVPNASILVKNYPSESNALIYSDNGSTPIINSTVITDSSGSFNFWAADGYYSLSVIYKGATLKTIQPVSIGDVPGLPTLAVLKTWNGNTNGQAVIVSGYTTSGDGGGGEFYWGAYATDNGGTIITPTGQNNGSWHRLLPNRIKVTDFGADPTGNSDSTTAIQKALDVVNSGGSLFWPSGTYVVSSTLKISNLCACVADGFVTINVTGNVDLFNISNQYSQSASTHVQSSVFEGGFYFKSDSITNNCMILGDTGTTYGINNKSIARGCTFIGFQNAIKIGNNCFGVSFDGCNFISNVNCITTLDSLTNSGESIVFSDCTFTDATGSVLENINSSTYMEFMFMNCRIDYNNAFMDSNNVQCNISLLNCHIEYDNMTISHINVNGGTLIMLGCSISNTGVATISFMNLKGNGGIDIRANRFSSAAVNTGIAFCTFTGSNPGSFIYDRFNALFNYYWPTPVDGASNGTAAAIVSTSPSVALGSVPVSGTTYQNTSKFTEIHYIQGTMTPTTGVNALITYYLGATSGGLVVCGIETIYANSNTDQNIIGHVFPLVVPAGFYWKVVGTNVTFFSGGTISGV